jgi:solute:Na+ symporter, SSS family
MAIYLSFAVLAVYLAALLWIGFRGRRLASDSDMFNIFGRRAGFLRATSGYLSLIGGGELITLSQLGYENGISVLWFLTGVASGSVFLAFFSNRMRELSRTHHINTLAGYFRAQYGSFAAVCMTVIFIVSLGSLLVIQFIVGSQLLNVVTGISKDLSATVMALVIVGYLSASGFIAVLSTDVVRAFFMTIVLFVICLFILPGQVGTPSFSNFVPLTRADGVIYFALGFFGATCAADVWQIIFASKDRNIASNSLLAGALAFVVIGFSIALMGMITKLAVPSLGEDTPAFIAAVQSVIPAFLAPLVALLVVGSVMATADSEIWVLSTLLVSLRLPAAGQQASNIEIHSFDDKYRKSTAMLIPVITLIAVILSVESRNAQGLYQGLLILLTILAPAMITSMFTNVPRSAVNVSMVAGVICYLILAIFHNLDIPIKDGLYPVLAATISFLVVIALRKVFGKTEYSLEQK